MTVVKEIIQGMKRVPRATWLGIVAAVGLYLGATVCSIITLPWKGTADAFAHLDYVYQVHHRSIPGPIGYAYRKVPTQKFNIRNPDEARQWASAHPPLFYALESMVMGNELDAGRWQSAVLRGRLLNMLFGLFCVLALAWSGWSLGGRHRAALSVALPAVAGCLPVFIKFSGEIYNDILVTLCSIVGITISCIILRQGLTVPRVIALTLLCMCGMATKATFIFVLALAALALFVALMLRYWREVPRWLAFSKAALASIGFAIIVVLPVSWFYLRNQHLSGSWFRSAAKAGFGARNEKTLSFVLTDDNYWLLVPRGLFGPAWRIDWAQSQELSIVIFFLSLLGVVGVVWASGWLKRLFKGDRVALSWLVILAHVAGLMLAQAQHAVGWGQYNVRYFLPALLSIGLLLAGPVSIHPRVARFGIPALAALMALASVMYSATYLKRAYKSLAPGGGAWERLLAATEHNGLASVWLNATLAVMATSLLLLTIAMWTITRAESRSNG